MKLSLALPNNFQYFFSWIKACAFFLRGIQFFFFFKCVIEEHNCKFIPTSFFLFFYFSINSTKYIREKIKKFLSFHFFITSPFSILLLFHHSIQTNPYTIFGCSRVVREQIVRSKDVNKSRIENL